MKFPTKNLTVKRLKEICLENKYIALRDSQDNTVIGYNCSISKIIDFAGINENRQTKFIGFYPISFNEYISIKCPFKS